MTYGIAASLPFKARMTAAAHEYPRLVDGHPDPEHLWCPLGLVLHEMGIHMRHRWPNEYQVANALRRHGRTETFRELRVEAKAFMADWDYGLIDNLAGALGVEELP